MPGGGSPLLKYAEVSLADGVPYSGEFDDVYASREGAYGQARSVFMASGAVSKAWGGKPIWRILENGFGLGTNFLAAADEFLSSPQAPERLFYCAVEGRPVTRETLLASHEGAPLSKNGSLLARELAAKWPDAVKGFHTLSLAQGRITLRLVFMDVREALRELSGFFDTLFLDGFSPKKNPDMWDPCVLRGLASHMREGAICTSWCTSGTVRRLLADAFFDVQKLPGFGMKRERLFAVMRAKRDYDAAPRAIKSVAVIGAGLAGAVIARLLAELGSEVLIFDDAPMPAMGASALRHAFSHPHFSYPDNPQFALTRAGTDALSRFLDLFCTNSGAPVYNASGAFECVADPLKEARMKAYLSGFKNNPYAVYVPKEKTREYTGLGLKAGGIFLKSGGVLDCQAFIRACLDHPAVRFFGSSKIISVEGDSGQWSCNDAYGRTLYNGSDVVLACASDSFRLAGIRHQYGQEIYGAITLLRSGDLSALRVPVSGAGYAEHGPGLSCVGATYEFDGFDSVYELDDNFKKLHSLFEEPPEAVATGFYRGVRFSGRGHMPYAGACPDEKALSQGKSRAVKEGLWLLAGLGSRGASYIVPAAQMLLDEMLGAPRGASFGKSLAKAVDPLRGYTSPAGQSAGRRRARKPWNY